MPQQTKLFDEHYFVVPPANAVPGALAELFREREALESLGETINPFSHGENRSWDSLRSIEHRIREEWPYEVIRATVSFVPLRQFFGDYAPIRAPFRVYYSDYATPVRAIFSISQDQLDSINAALEEAVPYRWCEDGEHQRPVILFGSAFWELSKKEVNATDRDLQMLFTRAAQEQSMLPVAPREAISETVRMFVWRRDEGRCAQCGSQIRLEFDHIIPVSKGGGNTARNVQLLCEQCNRKKCDHI